MSTRRLPSGALAALAVVLAALAVVVVAGARAPIVRLVVAPGPQAATHVTHLQAVASTPPRVPSGRVSPVGSSSMHRSLELASHTPSSSGGTTYTTTTTTSTTLPPATTTTTVTTTTVPTPAATPAPARFGYFEGGSTSSTVHLGAVRGVAVTVPAGVKVTLVVTCGLLGWHATAMTTVSFSVEGGGAACVATFSVPTSTPRPARWSLVTS